MSFLLIRRLLLSLALVSPLAHAGELHFERKGLALSGHDPVAYFVLGAPTPGKPEFSVTHEGSRFLFASAAHRERFLAEPARYLPQYAGHCAYGASNGYKAPADPLAWAIVNDKLYLNYNRAVQKRWNEDQPGHIRSADAAWPKTVMLPKVDE